MTASGSRGVGKVLGRFGATNAEPAWQREIRRLEELVEARIQTAADEALAMFERRIDAGDRKRRDQTETRVRIGVWEAEASASALVSRECRALVERVERRIRVASLETKAFADEGLASLSRSVAAAGRVVAGLVRRVEAGNTAQAALLDRVVLLERQQAEAAEAERLAVEATQAAAQAHEALNKRLHAIEGGFLAADSRTCERLDLLGQDLLEAVADYNEQLRHAEADIVAVREGFVGRFGTIETHLSRDRDENAARFDRVEEQTASVAAQLADGQALAARARDGQSAQESVARICNPAKVDALQAASRLRLDIGGSGADDDLIVRVDDRPVPSADIVAPLDALPLAAGSVEGIAVSHVVETMSAGRLADMLPHWHRLLAPGGRLDTVAFDGQALLEHWRDGAISFDTVQSALAGDPSGRAQARRILTPEDYLQALSDAGFSDAAITYAGQRNGDSFEFCVSATKP